MRIRGKIRRKSVAASPHAYQMSLFPVFLNGQAGRRPDPVVVYQS